jgi:hypothetical protein
MRFNFRWTADQEKFFKSIIDLKYNFYFLNWFQVYEAHIDVVFYGPGITLFVIKSTFGDVLITVSLTPLNPSSFKIMFRSYSSFWLGWFAKFCSWSLGIQAERDLRLWNLKKYLKNPMLVKEEKNLKEVRSWYLQFYSPNSKTYDEARNDLNW